MGEVVFSSDGLTTLRALGLGSCIGFCAMDPKTKIGCIAHIMLPEAKSPDTPEFGKYADTAVPYVLEEMAKRGVDKSRLRIAIVGGAQLFAFEGAGERLDVGKRNVDAVKRLIDSNRLKCRAEDTGGKSGRTVVLDATTGEVKVKLVGGQETDLVNLLN